jgi:hypothetical protein
MALIYSNVYVISLLFSYRPVLKDHFPEGRNCHQRRIVNGEVELPRT